MFTSWYGAAGDAARIASAMETGGDGRSSMTMISAATGTRTTTTAIDHSISSGRSRTNASCRPGDSLKPWEKRVAISASGMPPV